jgi:hypothetical protein
MAHSVLTPAKVVEVVDNWKAGQIEVEDRQPANDD